MNESPLQTNNDTTETYLFETNVNRSLSRILGIDEIKHIDMCDYEPPKEYGLSNCNVIIPSYYNLHKDSSKMFNIDYYEMIKDDIRNCRLLNGYQLKYIEGLSHECKDEIIGIYNNCIKLYNDIYNPHHS